MGADQPLQHTDVAECVEAVLSRVGKRVVLGLPLGLGKAVHVTNEFFRRARQDPGIDLTILTALSLEKPSGSSELERRFLEPFVERVFGGCPDLDYVLALRKGEVPANVRLVEFYFKPGQFLNAPLMQQNYVSTNYTFVARDIVDSGVNVMCQMVGKREDPVSGTRYSLSCNADVTLDAVRRLREGAGGRNAVAAVGQVNPNLPFMYGDADVPPELFDFVVDDPAYHHPLFGAPKMSVSTADACIGLLASALVRDGGTLQIGIGSLGDALVYGLIRRHRENEAYREMLDACEADIRFGEVIDRIGGRTPFEQGLYGSTEMLVDGYLHLLRNGVIKRRVYNHAGLQRLLNAGAIGEAVTPRTLELLLESGEVGPTLTEADVRFLVSAGILKEGLRYEGGCLVDGRGDPIPCDLSDRANLQRVLSGCLGSRLRGGVLIHAGFFLGPRDFYDALNAMTESERRQIWMTSVLHVNQLYGNAYASEELKKLQRRDARFVNAGLMVTLSGAVVSDGLEDGRVVSGVGGQYNFVSMAHALPGGRSILMIKSTRAQGSEVSSNVVWNYGHVTIARHLRDLVITEYGIADLRGKTDAQVIEALLNVADSRFQEPLLRTAKEKGKIPADYRIPDRFRNNTPGWLERALKPLREKGLLPAFPFGTDFTQEELVLGKALRGLKEKMGARTLSIPSLRDARKLVQVPEGARPYLERMQLDRPATAKETMMQRMVVYALASQGVV